MTTSTVIDDTRLLEAPRRADAGTERADAGTERAALSLGASLPQEREALVDVICTERLRRLGLAMTGLPVR